MDINRENLHLDLTVKKLETSLIADKWAASPLTATVAVSSREALPFNRGRPLVDMAVSAKKQYFINETREERNQS